ncbi:MAG: ABC transporter substrate-binding protein [Candidatus Bathyarchaeia archaeon]
MLRIVAIVLIVIVIVAAVVVWYIFQPKGAETIKIGLLANRTGVFAEEGIRNEKMAELAVEKINADGGIYVREYGRKLPVELIVYDCESDAARTVEIATKMVTEVKPTFLLTSSAPPYVLPVVNVVERQGGVIFVQCDAAPAQVYKAGMPENVLWSWILGSSIGYAVMGYEVIFGNYKNQTNGVVGILCMDDPDGQAWNATMVPVLKKHGYTIVHPGLYPADLQDFSVYVTIFKENKVEAVWLIANPPQFADFWRKSSMLGFKPKLVAGGRYLVYPSATAEMIGGELALGLISEAQWHPDWPFPGNDWVNEAWSRIGLDYHHGAVHIVSMLFFIETLIEEAGTLDVHALNEKIPDTESMSPIGKIKFDAKTHLSLQYMCFIQQVKSEGKWKFNIIWSPPDSGIPTKPTIFPLPL